MLADHIQPLIACVGTTDLDLSGNPVWFQPGCKHALVASLSSLRRYDDELITDLDRELASDLCSGAARITN